MKLRYGDDKRKKKSVDLNSDHNFRLSLQYYTDTTGVLTEPNTEKLRS